MSIEVVGPVSMAETSRVLSMLRALSERAQVNEQHTLFMVLSLTAESFSDNLEMAADVDDVE